MTNYANYAPLSDDGPAPLPPEYELLAAILKNVPPLSDAACKRHPGVHEDDGPIIVDMARTMFQHCPCRQRCRDWVNSMQPRERQAMSGI